MAGDILLTSSLAWPASSAHYQWVLDFLVEQSTRPGARTALEEADETGIGIVDLAELAIEDRDELYELLRDRLVPTAALRIPADAVYRDAYLSSFGELRDLATMALDRYRGKEIADHAVVLAPGARWNTSGARYRWLLAFLTDRASVATSAHLTRLRDDGATELDLTDLPADHRAEVLGLLGNALRDHAARLPTDLADRDDHLRQVDDLVDLARNLT